VGDGLSARQLVVASFTGLLAPAVMTAGMDWRGALLAVPTVLVAAWSWSFLGRAEGGWTVNWRKGERVVLPIIYIIWLVTLAGMTLAEAGARITAPDEKGAGWAVVLIWIPVLLFAKGKPTVLGRSAEIFYLAMAAALAMIFLFALIQIRPGRLLGGQAEIERSILTAAGTGCTGVVMLILWEGGKNEGKPKWMVWSGTLMAVLVLARVVTVGTLGAALAQEQERPFFTMTVGLGQTSRVEGLVNAVWLLSDVTLAGLLAQCGRKLLNVMGITDCGIGAWSVALAILGTGLSLRAVNGTAWMWRVQPVCGILLGGVVPLLTCLGGVKRVLRGTQKEDKKRIEKNTKKEEEK